MRESESARARASWKRKEYQKLCVCARERERERESGRASKLEEEGVPKAAFQCVCVCACGRKSMRASARARELASWKRKEENVGTKSRVQGQHRRLRHISLISFIRDLPCLYIYIYTYIHTYIYTYIREHRCLLENSCPRCLTTDVCDVAECM